MRAHAPDTGFGLMEAIVSLALLGIVAASAVAALASNLESARRARGNVEAASLAEWRMAQAALLGRGDLEASAGGEATGPFAPPFSAYQWVLSVRAVDGVPDLFEVVVVVEGAMARQELSAHLFRPGAAYP